MNKKFTFLILAGILFLGFCLRLYKIDNPIADWHSWRQADTSAVTRNFLKFGVHPLFPLYDDFSDVSGNGLYNPKGYRMVEFPVFNLVHYLLFMVFRSPGLEYWGRMTSVLSSLVSAVLLFFIVRRHTRTKTGLLTAFFFLFLPYNIYFSRVVLPDPMMVTLYLATLNFFDVWISRQKLYLLVLTGIFGGLALLVKPVAAFFLLPMFWQVWQKWGKNIFRDPRLYVLAVSVILPFLLWRFWEHRHPEGIPASVWLLNGDHIRFKGAFFQWIFGERLGALILGKWGIYPLASGIITFLSDQTYFLMWLLSALIYLFTFATGNVRHDYYQIPIIPVVAVTLALGTAYLWKAEAGFALTWGKRLLVITSVAFMFAFSWYDIRGNYQINHWEIVHAGAEVNNITPPDAVVIAPYDGDTAFLYQTNRRGFSYLPLPIKDLIDQFHATYYVSVNYDDRTNAIMKKYTVVEKTPEFVIVKLLEPKSP